MLTASLLGLGSLAFVAAQSSEPPLAGKRFQYANLPYKADPSVGAIRGPQAGYNICNSTTAGQDSLCQTAIVNSLDDFCLWGPQELAEEIGNIEGEMVAWCTKGAEHGARQIPPGALQGVQFIRAKNYVQVTGYINQQMINILPEDFGGEMDPHGADNRGNPIGGLLFSNQFTLNASSVAGPQADNSTRYAQVTEWHNFMGNNMFCLKACDPAYEEDYRMCEHIYDRVGCNVNAPTTMRNNTFLSCDGDDQLFPGVYVGANNVTSTYTQPPEGQVIQTLPYVPSTPSTSNCVTYESASIYALAAESTSATSSASSTTVSSGASSAATGSATTQGASSGAAGASGSRNSAAAGATSAPTSPANRIAITSSLLAAVAAVGLFLA